MLSLRNILRILFCLFFTVPVARAKDLQLLASDGTNIHLFGFNKQTLAPTLHASYNANLPAGRRIGSLGASPADSSGKFHIFYNTFLDQGVSGFPFVRRDTITFDGVTLRLRSSRNHLTNRPKEPYIHKLIAKRSNRKIMYNRNHKLTHKAFNPPGNLVGPFITVLNTPTGRVLVTACTPPNGEYFAAVTYDTANGYLFALGNLNSTGRPSGQPTVYRVNEAIIGCDCFNKRPDHTFDIALKALRVQNKVNQTRALHRRFNSDFSINGNLNVLSNYSKTTPTLAFQERMNSIIQADLNEDGIPDSVVYCKAFGNSLKPVLQKYDQTTGNKKGPPRKLKVDPAIIRSLALPF